MTHHSRLADLQRPPDKKLNGRYLDRDNLLVIAYRQLFKCCRLQAKKFSSLEALVARRGTRQITGALLRQRRRRRRPLVDLCRLFWGSRRPEMGKTFRARRARFATRGAASQMKRAGEIAISEVQAGALIGGTTSVTNLC